MSTVRPDQRAQFKQALAEPSRVLRQALPCYRQQRKRSFPAAVSLLRRGRWLRAGYLVAGIRQVFEEKRAGSQVLRDRHLRLEPQDQLLDADGSHIDGRENRVRDLSIARACGAVMPATSFFVGEFIAVIGAEIFQSVCPLVRIRLHARFATSLHRGRRRLPQHRGERRDPW